MVLSVKELLGNRGSLVLLALFTSLMWAKPQFLPLQNGKNKASLRSWRKDSFTGCPLVSKAPDFPEQCSLP